MTAKIDENGNGPAPSEQDVIDLFVRVREAEDLSLDLEGLGIIDEQEVANSLVHPLYDELEAALGREVWDVCRDLEWLVRAPEVD